MRPGFTLLCIFLFVAIAGAQNPGRINSLLLPETGAHHHEEYNFDAPVNPQAWTTVKPGLHAQFGSEEELYFRTEVPGLGEGDDSWKATGWRGERLNMQIITWSRDSVYQVRFSVSDLKNEQGNVISRDQISLYKINYVLANYPYGSREGNCGATPFKEGYLMPDRFSDIEKDKSRFDLPGQTVRPVWVSVNIPRNAQPGKYSGTITVQSTKEKRDLHISIVVQNQQLPLPHEWKYRLDLWQNPWVIAEYFNVVPWSDAHKALLKQHLKLYADAGGKYITTYGVHSPWGDNEYRIEGGMIEWTRKKDGNWKFDYSIFDQYVSLAMSVGIDKAITIYTPLPWGERFRYKDESTGNYVVEQWLPREEKFQKNWNIFLTDLRAHLRQKQWLEKTYLGINENAMEQTLIALKMIKQHDPAWKITYAGDWHQELDTLLDDYCFVHGKEGDRQIVTARQAKGKTTTYYVCCTPSFPNNFLFSPPIEGRWISWYASAHGYSGFLRWAYDAWPEDPVRDGRFGSWPAGDCFLVYPGGNSSIRFEKLREGIVDFEKIRIVKELAARSPDPAVKKLIQDLDRHLDQLNAEKGFATEKLKADVDTGKKLIESVSDQLASKK